MASEFENATFVTYEQIHPDDGFGQVMVRHFANLQIPLLSVSRYPTLNHQTQRYVDCVSTLPFHLSTSLFSYLLIHLPYCNILSNYQIHISRPVYIISLACQSCMPYIGLFK